MDLNNKINDLTQKLTSNKFLEVIKEGKELTNKFPNLFIFHNILGLAYQGITLLEDAEKYFPTENGFICLKEETHKVPTGVEERQKVRIARLRQLTTKNEKNNDVFVTQNFEEAYLHEFLSPSEPENVCQREFAIFSENRKKFEVGNFKL